MPSTISAGTTAGTAIAIAGDTTGNLAFQTNGTTTAMTINTSQQVGIGTTSPAFPLDVSTSIQDSVNFASSNANMDIYLKASGTTSGFTRLRATGGDMVFITGLNERMRIDSSGRVTTPFQPAFLASIASASDATVTAGNNINFNSTSGGFNVGNHFNTSTNLFTAPIAGKYLFTYHLFFTSSSGGGTDQQAAIAKNNAYVTGGSDAIGVLNYNPAAYNGSFTSAIILDLAANDTVSVKGRTNLRIYQGHCIFEGYLLG